MIRAKRLLAILLTFLLISTAAACSKQSEKPTPESETGPPEQPEVIEELESDILKIMTLSDKVPFFERVIVEKEKIEEEKKAEEKPQEAGQPPEESQGQESEEGEKPKEGGGSPEQEEKPKPMTINESILDEVLKREKTEPEDGENDLEKPPNDISETWEKINATIKGVHDKWNVLEPLLIQQSMSPEVITEFEETLDRLTNQGIQKKYLETITSANKLTSYVPKFMSVFKKEVPPTVFTLKYLVRDVVLNSAVQNYTKAQESLDKIKEQSQSVKSQLIEKKAKSTADKFDASVNNLQKSLDKKDINLIRSTEQ